MIELLLISLILLAIGGILMRLEKLEEKEQDENEIC
jgi:hypothetical protein